MSEYLMSEYLIAFLIIFIGLSVYMIVDGLNWKEYMSTKAKFELVICSLVCGFVSGVMLVFLFDLLMGLI